MTPKGYDTERPMQEVHGRVARVKSGDTLNVREQPDAKSEIMAKIDIGSEVTVLGENMNGNSKWLLVTVGDKTGWVNAAYVDI